MNLGEKILKLRKEKGLSQEALAEQLGTTRQAVSKWESEQSTPDVDKIIIMSDLFGVTTDYLLKGIEAAEAQERKGTEVAGKVLYIASTAFVVIGLLCALGGWYAQQSMEAVWGSMIIQTVGIAGYFVGKSLSGDRPPFSVSWLNVIGMAWMPVSMLTGWIAILVFKQGWIGPYPMGIRHTLAFALVYLTVCAVSFICLRKSSCGK